MSPGASGFLARRREAALASALAIAALLAAAPGGCRRVEQAAAARWEPTPLDAYVAAPDPEYRFEPISKIEGEGYVAHVLELTSQRWRRSEEVDRTLWKHWLTIVVPEGASGDIAMLYLTGGRNGDPVPKEVDPLRLRLALATRTVVAELAMVPNQPLRFAGETGPLREDALIACGWERFLKTDDPTWLPRLPMTKAAVRAMDAVTAFCAGPECGRPKLQRFVLAGRSKRGWTAWTAAAVDRRVVAIVPMVIDVLNIEAQFEHHYRAYGFWSPAIEEYIKRGIPDWFGSEEMRALRRIVEPYEYRERLVMPKLILNGAGDEFFLPDSSRFYFDALPGEKHLRYVPGTGHSLGGTDALDTLVAFYREIVRGEPRPEVAWAFLEDGSIAVRVTGPRRPERVLLWQATNPETRDFRVSTIRPEGWTSRALEPEVGGGWIARVEPPARGFTAYLVELTFLSSGPEPLKLTTGVRVLPDVLPFDLEPKH